jgi:hypothetical protein
MNGLKYKRKYGRKSKSKTKGKRLALYKNPNSGLAYMYIESYDVIASLLGTTTYQWNSSANPYLNFSDMFTYGGTTAFYNLAGNWGAIKIISLDVMITDAVPSQEYSSTNFGNPSFPTYVVGCYPTKQSIDVGSRSIYKDDGMYITPGLLKTFRKTFNFSKMARMTGTSSVAEWIDMSSNGSYADIRGQLHVRTSHSHNTSTSVHVGNVRSRFLIACKLPTGNQ